ncbi:hypothetical protein [Metamycoplasma hyosynoviae]|uniref:hypothetical protein n=1 Tax=Metamycoplasma hyosynoviae TaxID=29559 RepID=UPI000461781A|nr:hypothetical protein [Metamycoplasma hyosynoviae]KDE43557.1 hypothetical protein NPL1_00420 [Metamycoplasma hyosynoviae]MDC8900478.1 hypothetical protein [Metamycoplasma hyosynoviae]MDC8911870.1 hypothetical protein [Metamycoplasma hyosynoviae]MDC8937938.1 hypothetical protein [Metamycoplasma hyosynoviae]MDD1366364.1 hypothetical protein [Metamycoplasma hyosynoviae]
MDNQSPEQGIGQLKSALRTILDNVFPIVTIIAGFAIAALGIIAIIMTLKAVGALKVAETQAAKKEAKKRIATIWLSFGFTMVVVAAIPIIIAVVKSYTN